MKSKQIKKRDTQQCKLSSHEKKHQVNLKNNSGLHFQIGLIVVLFMVFGIFQLQFEKKEYAVKDIPLEMDNGEIRPLNYVVEKPKVEPVKKVQPKRKKPSTQFIPVDNDTDIIKDLPIIDKSKSTDKKLNVIDVNVDEVPDEIDPIHVHFVTQIPTFPGCEKFTLKKDQMECMSKKIAKHINKKFDSDIAADHDISGIQKIMVMFTIDTNGDITDIKARSPHPALEKEAIEAVQSLPKMKPGKKGNKKVPVVFSQPIIFEVE